MVRNNRLVKKIHFNAIENVPVPDGWAEKFQKDYAITAKEVVDVMRFLRGVRGTWEDAVRSMCEDFGVLVEKLHEGTEIKIFVMMGRAIGHYYLKKFTKFDIGQTYKLAEQAAVAAGIDFVRVDIVRYKDEGYRVSELTFNPRVQANRCALQMTNNNFKHLVDFHTSISGSIE